MARVARRHLPAPATKTGLWLYKRAYIPLFSSGKQVYDLGDFSMLLDQSESSMMIRRRFGDYEPELSTLLSNELESGDTYVDIGSNKGYHVLAAASIVGESGTVYSFEPNPRNFSDLNKNVELNGFDNVHTYEMAVFDTDDQVRLDPGKKSGQGVVSDEGDIKINATTFDTFVEVNDIEIEKINLIKIDVEGSEAAVFDGMEEFLGRSEDCTIVVEVHADADIQRMTGVLHKTDCDFEKMERFWEVNT
jgi:FkbM family methyltransferase